MLNFTGKILLILFVNFSGFAHAGGLTLNDLQGTWQLTKIGGKRVQIDLARAPKFTINEESIGGFDGCNQFSGELTQPGRIRSTRMACREGTTMLPLDMFDLFAHLQTGAIQNRRLLIPAWKNFPVTEFEKE